MKQWLKKDPNQTPRTAYWLDVFGKHPIKAISTSDIRKALDHYAKGKCLKAEVSQFFSSMNIREC